MKLVVDANIFFSALLKNGLTRGIWFRPELLIVSPRFLLVEFAKYRPYLLKKYKRSDEEFDLLAEKLLGKLKFTGDAALKPFLPAAASLIDGEKDWFYIALALKTDAAIWSNDAGFKAQGRVRIFTTGELGNEIGLL